MLSNRSMAAAAAVSGLVATGLAFAYIRASRAGREPEPLVSVLFAAADLPANHVIDPQRDLRTETVGTTSAPALARAAVRADELDALRGRRISGPLPAGVPLMYAHLAAIRDIRLAPGKRAMTISVGRAGALGGILVPGDHVDVVVSYEVRGGRGGGTPEPGAVDDASPEAAIGAIFSQIRLHSMEPDHWQAREVLTDVRVVAVGNRLDLSRRQLAFGQPPSEPAASAGAVTLELSASEALELIRATAGGANPVTLLLRPAAPPDGAEAGGGLVIDDGGP